jgi:hypothetical protein
VKFGDGWSDVVVLTKVAVVDAYFGGYNIPVPRFGALF